MKIKLEFVLREIAGDILLVPVGKAALDLNGMLTLNEVGAEIWKMLPEVESEEEIVERLLQDYEVEPAQVREDVSAFLNRLRTLGIL
ncbi:MAG: PqqD family protein [Faecousia sp.]